jgi:hypothetical protein
MTFKILTITAALGLVASGAVAQTNDWLGTTVSYSADYRASYADARRAAYDNGYRDGVKRGEQAARDRRAFQVERERDYRDADNGYNREFGDRTRYRNDYRGGFAEGYRDGYQRDGRQARGYGYGDAGYGAFQNGTADGYRKGLDDLQDRKSPDARRQNWYRSGDHGYDKSYGSKDAYKDDYRRGFLQGYDRAFGERRRGF